jgi:protein transport protein SEC24
MNCIKSGYSTPNGYSQYNPPPPNGQNYTASGPPPSFPNVPNSSQENNAAFYPPSQPYYPTHQTSYDAPPRANDSTPDNKPFIRHASSNQMMALGIRSPDSSGYGSSAIPPPPSYHTQQVSPGAGSYTTYIRSASPTPPTYGQYTGHSSYPSPPSSGYGAPPTGIYNYQQGTSLPPLSVPSYQNAQYPPPPSGNYTSQGPPTIQTSGVAVNGGFMAADSPYYTSPAYTPGFSAPLSLESSTSPLRSLSADSNMGVPPTPSRQRNNSQGGNIKRVNSRIDPSQMPRPIRPADGVIYQTNSGTTTSSGRKIPPTSCVNFKVIDTGNCSPRCLRITSSAPPATKEVANMTGIPIAITTTPFSPPEGSEEAVPLVDAGENPPRCTRCRGYVNPHVMWSDGGNKWTCNLCSMVNNVPSYYYSALDGVGLRLDRKSRPELTHGTVDFLVGKDFSIRPLQEPIYVYAIDISHRAVASGLTAAALTAVRNSIGYLLGKLFFNCTLLCFDLSASIGPHDRIRVGIITFDRAIQFYRVKEDSLSDPVRILVVDSEDPAPPLPPEAWIFSLSSTTSIFATLLEKIPELIPALQGYDRDGNMTRNHPAAYTANAAPSPKSNNGSNSVPYDEYAQTCPTAVVKVVQNALASLGGKLFIMTSFSSNIGYGRLTTAASRDSQSAYGTAAELSTYAPVATAIAMADVRKASADERVTLNQYAELANLCGKSFVSVDIIVNSESDYLFPDYALLAEVSEQTGGNFHVFTGSLLLDDNVVRLQSQLLLMQQGLAGMEVMMKTRCSQGFRVEKMLGRGYYDDVVNELEVASISTSSTYCVHLKHDGVLKDDDKVYIQLAVLYTSPAIGRRVVRVHNLVTTATTSPQQVFRHADLDATVDVIVKSAIDKAFRIPLSHEKDGPRVFLTDTAIEILQKYRTHCSPDSSRGQLILPESLKLLPLYTLCALKHPALLDNFQGEAGKVNIASGRGIPLQVRAYERAYELRRLRSLPACQLMNSLYPRLYPLHQLDENDGELYQLLEGLVITKMPLVVPTISEVLESDGMYLLDDGGALYLYIGRAVPPHKLEEWFGLQVHPGGIYEKPKSLSLNINASYEAQRFAAIVQNLRALNWNKQELKIVWAGEQQGPDAVRFSLRLVEDSVYGKLSLVSSLLYLHCN